MDIVKDHLINYQMASVMDKLMTVKQNNRITNSFRDFTLYQEKIYMCIMAALQEPINLSFLNKDYSQLRLFNDPKIIEINIPLNLICKARDYSKARNSILEMVSKTVTFRYFDKNGQPRIFSSSIFSADIPEIATWKSTVILKMQREVADYLIEISKDAKGIPIQYTKYILNTALNFKIKYSPKFYLLICSWKKKGAFQMSKIDLYEHFSVNPNSEYPIFKRDILKKVQKELKEKSDVYFEFKEIKDGKTVVGVDFRVFSKEVEDKDYQLKSDSVRNMLKLHFGFTDSELELVKDIFDRERFCYNIITKKLNHVQEYFQNPDHIVYDRVKYTITALEGLYDK